MIGTIFGEFKPLRRFGMFPYVILSVALLAVRFFVAMPYWNSGWTKWASFPTQINSGAKYLFSQEYKLHILGTAYDMPFPELLAYFAALGEVVLPVLLVIGLFSRFAGLGLLGMTCVIQLVYPGAWALHAQWALAALTIFICGPGIFSLDAGIRKLIKA